jgi:hypothetical protein
MKAVNVREDLLTRELQPPLTAAQALVEADRCLGCGGAHAEAPYRAAGERRSVGSAVSPEQRGDRALILLRQCCAARAGVSLCSL